MSMFSIFILFVVVVLVVSMLNTRSGPSLKSGPGKWAFRIAALLAGITIIVVQFNTDYSTIKLLGLGAVGFFLLAAIQASMPKVG